MANSAAFARLATYTNPPGSAPGAWAQVDGADFNAGDYLATWIAHVALCACAPAGGIEAEIAWYPDFAALKADTPDPRLHQSFLFGDRRIRQVIDMWLDQGLDLDAIFASADIAAISLIGALNERGLGVPSQVRVVGYDDIALSAYLHPSLTSIRQPTAIAGRALVELLFEAIAGLPRRSVMLPAELVVRDSSA